MIDVESRQVPGAGRACYALKTPAGSQGLCRFCGTDVVRAGGRWYALEARWPNLGHCYYSARDGASVGHDS